MPNIKGISTNIKGDINITTLTDTRVDLLRTDLTKLAESVDTGTSIKTNTGFDTYIHCYEDLKMVNTKRTAVLVCNKGYVPPKEWWKGTQDTICPTLGMNVCATSDNKYQLSDFLGKQIDDLLYSGFTNIRTGLFNWNSDSAIAREKEAILLIVSKGAYCIAGVSSGAVTLTSINWASYCNKTLELAQWAQDNGVSEFQIGNEEETHTSINQATLRNNIRKLATDVKKVFKRNVSYSLVGDTKWINPWLLEGKGDLDLLAFNCYRGGIEFGDMWKELVDKMTAKFGNEMYISEFSVSGRSLSSWSVDEAVQANGIQEMLEYFKAKSVPRAIFYDYYDDPRPWNPAGFGALKTDRTYRKLWDVLRGCV